MNRQAVKEIGHGIAGQLTAAMQSVAIGEGQRKLRVGNALAAAAFIKDLHVAHGVAIERNKRHFIVRSVQRGNNDQIGLILRFIGSGGLPIGINAQQQNAAHPFVVAVLSALIGDDLILLIGQLRPVGGLVHAAAAMQPDEQNG